METQKPAALSVGDVASLLRTSKKWVYKWAKELPGYMKLGGSVMFHARLFHEGLEKKALTKR